MVWRAAFAVLGTVGAGAVALAAGTQNQDTKTILAAQLRDQGYACDQPKSAEQDAQASKPDQEVWIVQCENARYRMRLHPDMAAEVEQLDKQ
jgi:hypothetical protein